MMAQRKASPNVCSFVDYFGTLFLYGECDREKEKSEQRKCEERMKARSEESDIESSCSISTFFLSFEMPHSIDVNRISI